MCEDAFEYVANEDGVTLTGFHPESDPEGSFTFPGVLGGRRVTEIGSGAFSAHGSEITELTVPEGVKRIDSDAFTWMLFLKKLNLPESLEKLETGFAAGTSLQKLVIPKNVREIDEVGTLTVSLAFEAGNPVWSTEGIGVIKRTPDGQVLAAMDPNCSVKVYCVPKGVTKITSDAFSGQENLEELQLPASLREIEEGAFSNVTHMYSDKKGIRRVTFPEGSQWFSASENCLVRGGCLLRWFGEETAIQVPNNVSAIASEAFYRCPAEKIILPPSVKTIHPRAFVMSAAKEVDIGADDLMILFPDGGTYLQEKLMEEFGKDGKRYPFSYYDRCLYTGLLDLVKARMLLNRLSMEGNPAADLSPQVAQKLRSTLSGRLPDLFQSAAVKNDTEMVRELAAWDGMTEADFEKAIQIMTDCGRQEMIACLVRRKLEAVGHDDFDFSL